MSRILILCVAMSVSALGQNASTLSASGTCAVANTGNQNTFTINCGIGMEQGQKMLAVLNTILSKQLDPDAVMLQLDHIGSKLEKIGQDDAAIRDLVDKALAEVKQTRKEVAEIRHGDGNPSARALIKVTSDLSSNLRGFGGVWQSAVQDVHLRWDEEFYYHTPPLSQPEMDEANKVLERRVDIASSEMRQHLLSLLKDADTMRASLLASFPPDKQTIEDKKKHEEILQLEDEMWKWYDYGCCPKLASLADYLDGLAKRL